MDNLNKTISFILGLVVVLVFLAVVTGRLNLRKLPVITKSATPTPAPTTYVSPTPAPTSTTVNKYQTKQTTTTAEKIPATGSPTLILSSLIFSLIAGLSLRRASKARNS